MGEPPDTPDAVCAPKVACGHPGPRLTSAWSRPACTRIPIASGSAPAAHAQAVRRQEDILTVKRMDNVGIVVEDIDAAIEFFTELGLTLEGRMPIEGEWAGRVTGVRGQRVEIAMMRTPDGHSRLELSRFDAPAIASDHRP